MSHPLDPPGLTDSDWTEIKRENWIRRLTLVAVVLVIVAIPFGAVIHFERGVSFLADDAESGHEGCGAADIRHHYVVETPITNKTAGTLTLRSLTFAFGIPPGATLFREGITSNVTGIPLCTSNSWRGQAPRLKLVAGFSLAPHRSAVIFDFFALARPGYYRFADPIVYYDRPDLWGYMPGVGSSATFQDPEVNLWACTSLSDLKCTASGFIVPENGLVGGRPVLGIRWHVKDHRSRAGLQGTGYFTQYTPGAQQRVWYTERKLHGSYLSPVLDITKQWTFYIPVTCPRRPYDYVRMWSEHPDGSHRAYFPPGPSVWKVLDKKHWKEDQAPQAGIQWTTGGHDLGRVRIHFQSRCTYTVIAYGMPKRQSV